MSWGEAATHTETLPAWLTETVVVPPLIKKWELELKVKVARYFLQRMKTKWGSCDHKARQCGEACRMRSCRV
jgi:hypothetical protein